MLFRPDFSDLVFVGEPILDSFGSPQFGWYEESGPINYKYLLGGVSILDIAAGAFNMYTWSGVDSGWTSVAAGEVAAGISLGVAWALSYV
jgi:hypothetical protein